jgi:Transposase, Mutator family
VRSLAEDEEHLLTFYEFPQAMHRRIQTTNAIESLWSLVRQRTDQIDVLYFGDQLPHDRLGNDPGHSFAQNLAGMRLENERPEGNKQPTVRGGLEGGFLRLLPLTIDRFADPTMEPVHV